ncbi:MAG TPA: phosphatase PAP2 family protein [Pseudonocardiaceae bacterium]|nr:phosphatase PAP2 family protein [Pseudonocardiaceae bacterium]
MRRKSWIGAIDRRVMSEVARTDSVLLDQVLPTLGRSANYGRLWLGVAGALAATRNRSARRGALRGLVALSLASAVANVVSKQVVGRARPAVDLTPLARRLVKAPRTTSFPSGHSASAAAFTTGVVLESPLLGVPVAALAAAVAGSRVAVGAHYPSDVVAGVSLGVAAGLLTRWWWPLTPQGPAESGAPSRPVPAEPTGQGLVLVTNAKAGTSHDAVLRVLADELPAAEIVIASPDDDLPTVIEDAARRCSVLGVAGGDGTINLAARIAAGKDVPLLVVPAGTLNHFARDLGVDTAADAIMALRAGQAVRVDLGTAGDQVFVNTSSIGLYVDLVRFREHWEGRLGKWPAMLVGLVHILRHAAPQDMVVDGELRQLWMLYAGNCRYQPIGFAPTHRSRLDDGLLDVRIVDATERFARTRIVLAVLTGTLRWCPAYQPSVRSDLVVAATDGTIELSVDGEVTEVASRIELAKAPGALRVYRPAGAATGPDGCTG